MKRNFFGEPQPASWNEISDALYELGINQRDAEAEIFSGEGEVAPFDGPHCIVTNMENPDICFTTAAFDPTMDELWKILRDLGIKVRA